MGTGQGADRKGRMPQKEVKKLIDELLKKSEQARKDLEIKVESMVEKAIGKMNVAGKEDISTLEKRLELSKKRRH